MNNKVSPEYRKHVQHLDNGLVKVTIGRQVTYRKGGELGIYHREDGPAFIGEDGSWSWYKDGIVHREDGPATLDHRKTKRWFKNGKLHRLDGPAVEYPNGRGYFYLNGEEVKELPLTNLLLGFLNQQEK
jgi:hypothetical protein